MLNINKSSPPNILIEYRAKNINILNKKNARTIFDDSPRGDVLNALLQEQRRVCAYCTCRIDSSNASIEHFKSLTMFPGEALDYINYLAVCRGGEKRNQKSPDLHCDKSKGDKTIHYNPSNDDVERLTKYDFSDGKMTSDDPAFCEDIDALKLNISFLKDARKRTYSGFINNLHKKYQGNWSKKQIENQIKRYDGSEPGDRIPYSGIILYFLRKKLKPYK